MAEKQRREKPNLLDKAHRALDILMAEKDAKCAPGRFGVVIVRDKAGHTGLRYVIDEAIFVS